MSVPDQGLRVHVMKHDGTTAWVPIANLGWPEPAPRPEHPMQPVVLDDDGTPRFKENRLVRIMLDLGRAGTKYDLNTLVGLGSAEDYAQLMQLIGYSVSGFGDVSFVPKHLVEAADEAADRLTTEK